MPSAKISALTALDSTANLAQLYIPLFKADGSPDNPRILASDLLLAADGVNITPAWSGTGTATTPLLVNVTADPGPANAASKLLDLQVGGSSKVNVTKDGNLNLTSGWMTVSASVSPYHYIYNDSSRFIGTSAANSIRIGSSGAVISTNSSNLAVSGKYQFMSTFDGAGGNVDIELNRDAADILAQRRSTNGNTFKVYRTYTSSSTFERGTFGWHDSSSDTGTVGNVLRIGTEKGSVGGTGRDTALIANGIEIIRAFAGTGASIRGGMYTTDGTNSGVALSYETLGVVTCVSNGKIGFTTTSNNAFGTQDISLVRPAANILGITNGSTGGGALEFTEMTAPATPAADKARIFARDNGSGKTQVCIILPDGVVTVLATQT